jgi:hypothetical protein
MPASSSISVVAEPDFLPPGMEIAVASKSLGFGVASTSCAPIKQHPKVLSLPYRALAQVVIST